MAEASVVFLSLDRVRYTEGDIDIRQQALPLVLAAELSIKDFLAQKIMSRTVMAEFFVYSTLFKHEGFNEEQEVRIVGIPMPNLKQRWDKRADAQFIETGSPDRRRRFVALFGCDSYELPVKRVIVGPSRNQEERLLFARSIVNNQVDIVRSATPWIPSQ